MAIITEDYVSFEVATLLRKKGFDGEVHAWHNVFDRTNLDFSLGEAPHCNIPAPTLQMAMKWLREVHNINIDIVPIWNQKRFEYQVFVVTPENAKHCYVDDKLYLGYEEAVEAAIKYCLEHLI